MPRLIVIDNPKDWPLQVPGAELVAARSYVADPVFSALRDAKIFNLLGSDSPQLAA
jgi:hypothetical protein